MGTVATIENMTEHYAPGVFAYSPITGEEYSANPSDYLGCSRRLDDARQRRRADVARTTLDRLRRCRDRAMTAPAKQTPQQWAIEALARIAAPEPSKP